MIPQHIYICDASVAQNIAFGLQPDKIDMFRVRQAADLANISNIIQNLSDGYNTFLGEGGVRLSGGQRQRIGIARALYKHSELLVLDEATSALDNRTEAEVMNNLENLKSETTVLLVAHRLSTVKNADRIVLLDNGQIKGIGKYEDLEANNSIFRAIARH